MNMNLVFQEFVTVALREALGLSSRTFGESGIPSLDKEGRVSLRPDLTWRRDGECIFVGDAKYKNVAEDGVPNADLYQLLTYVTALDLPAGLLVYAKDQDEVATYTATYRVRGSGKRLEVAALDLSGDLDQVLARVGRLAHTVRGLADEARRWEPAGATAAAARA